MIINLMQFKKISWKLTVIYAAIFSLVLIFLNAGVFYGVKYYLIQQAIGQVENTSGILTKRIIGTPYEQTPLTDPELVSETKSNSKIGIRIAAPDGRIINSSHNVNIDKVPSKMRSEITHDIEVGERHLLIKNSAVTAGGRLMAHVLVVRDLEDEDRFMNLLLAVMAIADCWGILISIVVGYVISRRILNPINKMAKTAQSISISDLNSRIDVGEANDELARLALTFNDMIGRLQLSLDKQNQFVADASHELRTPISVIQGYINLMDRWGKDEREVLQESIQAIKNETNGMKDLIEELLFLARSDSSAIEPQKQEFLLDDLLEEVAQENLLVAPNHDLRITVNGPIKVFADRKMIKQMLRALLDNSVKFTPKNGKIYIFSEANSGQVKIEVRDTGIGIPLDEMDKVFARFYRVDKTRSKKSGGSGLGLSIVKRIVDIHGGTVVADSVLGQGTTITIFLPQHE